MSLLIIIDPPVKIMEPIAHGKYCPQKLSGLSVVTLVTFRITQISGSVIRTMKARMRVDLVVIVILFLF